ncbi:FIST domain-containing protein, partial [Durusdinium trenchii]
MIHEFHAPCARSLPSSSSLTHARETTGPTTASSLRAHGAVSWTRRKLEASGVKSPGLGLQRWRESLVVAAASSCAFRRSRVSRRATPSDAAVFCSALSTCPDWRSAVAELSAEATYKLRSRERRGWDFALVHVTGHDGISVSDVTLALDQSLGTKGNCLGVAVNGCGGPGTDHHRQSHVGRAVIQLVAVQLPVKPGRPNVSSAKSFFVGQRELQQISGLVCQLQNRTRVIGAQESALPRAWRQFLGVLENEERPKGILLFIDPLASKYVVGTTLSALDLAFPTAVKCGGVCADLLPSRKRLCVAAYERARLAGAGAAPSGVDEPEMGGVAGILLPADVSIHSVVSTGSSRVGPELRVTSAQGQVIKQMQFDDDKEAHPAAEMLQAVCRQATPLQQLLIERSGFLLG